MLRCSNVNALRTGVGNAVAMRAALSPTCRRTFQSRSSATSLSTSVARRTPLLSRTGLWKPLGDVKAYSTEINEPSEAAAEPDPPTTKRPPRPGHRNRNDEQLFALAMASGSSNPSPSVPMIPWKVVDKELEWLQDPKELAHRVSNALRAGNVAMGVALVRTAQSRRMECQVAWNTLLEFSMDIGSARSAFRFYNDMKKRGRMPNSHTYTIMLHGLSKAPPRPGFNPVEVALAIYRSISTSASDAKASIIHSNAMLSVCTRQGAMDTLWQIASELPEDGPGSPEATTYTIILQGIGDALARDVKMMSPDNTKSILGRRAQGVTEAKRIWADVVYRWKKGDLVLDNRLVDTMGQVLLKGPSDYETYEVFLLLNQTTGLPILAKQPPKVSYDTNRARLSGSFRERADQEEKDLEDVPFVDEGERLYRPPQPEAEISEEEVEAEAEEENLDDVFKPVVPDESATGSEGPSHLPLTNRELYRVVESCSAMPQGLGIAKEYWKLITQDGSKFKVKPDQRSFFGYLWILHASRASRAAVELMRDEIVPSGQVHPRMFFTALYCCRRDINNINVLKHANELLGLMDSALPIPYTEGMAAYAELITGLKKKPQLLLSLSGVADDLKRPGGSLESLGHKLRMKLQAVAIDNLLPHAIRLDNALERGRVRAPRHPFELEKPHKIDSLSGSRALSVLSSLRYWVHAVLDSRTLKDVPKQVQEDYNDMSRRLRKYSDREVQARFAGKIVSPPKRAPIATDDRNAKPSNGAEGADGAE